MPEDEIVAAFRSYRRHLNPRARLFLLGGAEARTSDGVTRTGPLDAAGLKAYLLLAHVFLCANHDPETCPLLVQALRYRIPSVAWGHRGALAPLARFALVWNRPDPEVVAESVHQFLVNRELAAAVVERQLRFCERVAEGGAVARCLGTLDPAQPGRAA